MNEIILIGNLTRDPELRSTGTGVAVCNFAIAVNRRQRGADGQQETDFFEVTAWRQLGENCAKYLAKGRKVAVTGQMLSRSYEGKDGQRRTAWGVTADNVEFLSPAQGDQRPPQVGYAAPAQTYHSPADMGFTQVEDDELPF